MKDLKGVQTGVYGSDVRYALTDNGIDFRFDAMDMCFTDAVRGKDSVLFYDSIYTPTIKEQADKLRKIGFDVDLEVI